MPKNLQRIQIEDAIEELVAYQTELDEKYPTDGSLKLLKSYKQFLMECKVEELLDRLIDNEIEYKIAVLVANEAHFEAIYKNNLLLEWEQYKNIPKTNLTYRYDAGQNRDGMEDHIHVYLGNTKNQIYAINRSGTPHDGSKAKLSKKEIKFLQSIGFNPPTDGLLEWITLDANQQYIGYNRQYLLD